jgi:type I restriction enzyme M protein
LNPLDFDAEHVWCRNSIEAKYAPTISAETKRLEAAIVVSKETRDADKRKTLQKELADYKKQMAATIATETRAILKERFPYAIFLYEAEKVGLTATGEQDQNELVLNDNQPPGTTRTCLELYQEFRRNPGPFFLTEPTE